VVTTLSDTDRQGSTHYRQSNLFKKGLVDLNIKENVPKSVLFTVIKSLVCTWY